MNAMLERAYKLFRAIHKRGAHKGEIVELEGTKTVALEVGEILRIDYTVKGERAHFFHHFRRNRPVLFISSDGSQAFILAGGYRFTSKGFEE